MSLDIFVLLDLLLPGGRSNQPQALVSPGAQATCAVPQGLPVAPSSAQIHSTRLHVRNNRVGSEMP